MPRLADITGRVYRRGQLILTSDEPAIRLGDGVTPGEQLPALDPGSVVTTADLPGTMAYDTGSVRATLGVRSATARQSVSAGASRVAAAPDCRYSSACVDDAPLAWDQFARSGSTLGTSEDGSVWTQTGAAIRTASGAASQASPGSWGIGYVQVNAANGGVSLRATFPSGDASVIAVLTAIDTSNFYWVEFRRTSGANDVRLWRRLAGTDTLLNTWDYSATTPNLATGLNQLRVTVSARVFRVSVGGVQHPTSYTDADTTIAAGTSINFGFGFGASDTGSTITEWSAVQPTLSVGSTIHGWSNQAGRPARQRFASFCPTVGQDSVGRPTVSFSGTSSGGDWFYDTGGISSVAYPATWVAAVNLSANEAGTPRTIFGCSKANGLQLRVAASGAVELLKQSVGAIISTTATVPNGQTTIIALTLTAAGDYVLYVNGRPVESARINSTQLGYLTTADATATLTIGSNGSNTTSTSASSELLAGSVYELHRYSRVLGAEELRALFDGLATKTGAVLAPRLSGSSSSIAVDRRHRGANYAPVSSQYAPGSAWSHVWGDLWSWTAVKEQIDLAKAAGANSFRLIGDLGVATGYTYSPDLSTYITRQQQVADYLASVGMTYYPSLGDLSTAHRNEASWAQIQSLAVSLATALATRPNVWALEIAQEANNSKMAEEVLFMGLRAVARAVRAAAPNLPLSVSNPTTAATLLGRAADLRRLTRLEDVIDIFDFHVYPDGVGEVFDPALLTPLLVASDKPIVIGEYGSDRTNDTLTDEQRATYYANIAAFVRSSPRVIGAYQWAVKANDYGLYNAAGVAQTDISAAFAAGPTTF